MPKIILLVKRKPGLTHEQFREHYENVHAPLAMRSLPHIAGYIRNYLAPIPGLPEPVYDCVTEFVFDSEEGMKASLTWTRSEEGQVLARDEETFMDRPAMLAYRAEEVETPMSKAPTA